MITINRLAQRDQESFEVQRLNVLASNKLCWICLEPSRRMDELGTKFTIPTSTELENLLQCPKGRMKSDLHRYFQRSLLFANGYFENAKVLTTELISIYTYEYG